MSKTFKIYDDVWIIRENKPQKYKVFSIKEEAKFLYGTVGWSTVTKYEVVKDLLGSGLGKTEFTVDVDDMYETKEECVRSLI